LVSIGIVIFGIGLIFGIFLFGGTTTTAPSPTLQSNTVIVPSITGDSVNTASQILSALGLVMSGANAPGGGPILIGSQSPRAGTHVHRGSTIKITLT
jgi:beta-lactam-binding protein with PASTA domain